MTFNIPHALRQHFDLERAKKLFAMPALDEWAKRLKRQDERLAAIVAASLNMKDTNR